MKESKKKVGTKMGKKLKALSVKQAWAWLIASGRKPIETRTWATNYRGPILIVSSKARMKQKDFKCFYERFGPLVALNLKYGKALCTANLVGCRPMTKADEKAAGCELYDGAYSWVLEDVKRIEPFAVKGQLGIYEVELKESEGKDV